MPKCIPLPAGKALTFWYSTTHHTSYRFESRAAARARDEYVTRLFYEHSGHHGHYVVMAYQQAQHPAAILPQWGIYRVEELPGYWYPEGNYTLLRGDMTRKEAFTCFAETVCDDPGHRHTYWAAAESMRMYQDGTMKTLTAHCWHCSRCIYNEEVERLLTTGAVSVVAMKSTPVTEEEE